MSKLFKVTLRIALCLLLSLSLFSCETDNRNSGTNQPIERHFQTLGEFSSPSLPSFKIETPTTKKERTVYVSKSGKKIHRNKKCSGMKYYLVMSEDEAIDAGYELCENCY